MPKDKNTEAAPMTYEVVYRPNVRYQLQVEAREAAASEAPKATTTKGK